MDSAEKIITDTLEKLGVDPKSARLPDAKGRGWLAHLDSVPMFVSLSDLEGESALRLVCPILYMPPRDLLPFYRKLLDLNMELGDVCIALDRDVVCVIWQQTLAGLTASAVETIMRRVIKTGNILKEGFVGEFPLARLWVPM